MPPYLSLLSDLRDRADCLSFEDTRELDAIKRQAEMLIRNIFGADSKYLTDLKSIGFFPTGPVIYVSGMKDTTDYEGPWNSGKDRLLNLLDTMKEELVLFGPAEAAVEQKGMQEVGSGELVSKGVFIVHGHDEEMKQSVARMLEKLGLKAIILHEQPNKGRTIIEKFEEYGSVASFAIVLLSPDDHVTEKEQDPSGARSRARQNVILELGFFLGKLGRERVAVIYRQEKGFEMPSDYSGVVYIPFDKEGAWQLKITKELKTAGYDVDANAL